MRFVVFVDGIHEAGTPESESLGAVEILLRRIIPDSDRHDYDVRKLSSVRLQSRSNRMLGEDRGNLNAHGKHLLRTVLVHLKDFDAVIVLIDEDGVADRRKAVDQCRRAIQERLDRAVVGIAIRSFDAWFLADQVALTNTLGVNVPQQRNPESDPDPKATCTRLANAAGLRRRDLYARASAILDIDLLAKSCPAGFAPFRDDLTRMPGVKNAPSTGR